MSTDSDQEMSNEDFFRAHAQVVRERKAQACSELHEMHTYENAKKLQPLFSHIERLCRMQPWQHLCSSPLPSPKKVQNLRECIARVLNLVPCVVS